MGTSISETSIPEIQYASDGLHYENALASSPSLRSISPPPSLREGTTATPSLRGGRFASDEAISSGTWFEQRFDAKGKPLGEPVCIDDEIPFDIPNTWQWVRLGTLCSKVGSGSTPPGGKNVYKSDGVMLIRSQNVYNDGLRLDDVARFDYELFEKRTSHVLPNDILLNITGASIGRCAIVPAEFEDADVNQHVLILRQIDISCLSFVHLVITSPIVQLAIMNMQVGATKEGLSATKARELLIPIPPIQEQLRIIKHLEKLLDLVSQYSTLDEIRERLDTELPERLRKSVLQQAAQGKLVEQDPDDEPASVLLERIRVERAKLIKEKKIKAPKGGESVIFRGSDGCHYEKRIDAKGHESEPVCIDDEIPFDIPDTWQWARLESVTTYIQRGKSPKYSPIKRYPVVAQKCNQWSGFSLEKAKFIDPDTVSKYADERILQHGDLMWNSTGLGTLGRMAVYDSEVNPYGWAVADSHVTVIRSNKDCLNFSYAFFYFASPSVQDVIEKQASGSTKQKELALTTVQSYLLPIPPQTEQKRIVSAVNRVLAEITSR